MKRLVAQAMKEGALGLRLIAPVRPGSFADTDELVELARVAASFGGIYISHQRSEGNQISSSLDEVFAIAERARIPAEIYHLKTAFKSNWGRMPEVLARIEAARARGLDITADQYPYARASNNLDACLPVWVREGGTDRMLARLKDPVQRERIRREMDDPTVTAWENQWYGSGGGEGVLVAAVLNPDLRNYEGKNLAEIGRLENKDPRDALMDLVIADRGEASCILQYMSEEDVRAALRHPLVAICTDSSAGPRMAPCRSRARTARLGHLHAHPRALRARREADHAGGGREEDDIAARHSRGLANRGILRPAWPPTSRYSTRLPSADVATFEDPTHYSVGIKWVLVNGRAVVADGRITAERPGRPLGGPTSLASPLRPAGTQRPE